MCSPQWPAGAVNWRGARTAGQRKTGQRKARYGSHQHQQPASSSSQLKKKKKARKKTLRNLPVIVTVRAVLTTPSAAERASIGRGA